jgi:hypothetical protein
VTGVCVFVRDTFAFQKDDNFYYWSCPERKFDTESFDNAGHLTGPDFSQFKSAHGRGGDFYVYTPLHEVENYQGMSYEIS